MAFIKSDSSAVDVSATAPNATNFIDMFEKIVEFADDTNNSVQSVGSIAAGGTSGYALGDILQLADGAATEAFPTVLSGCRATFEVTGVSTGQVTAVRIRNAGCYSTLPTNNGTANEFDTTILSGSGVGTVSLGGVTFDGNGWTIARITQEIATATIGAVAGSGYAASDTIELVGGDSRTGFDSPRTDNQGVLTLGTLTSGSSMTVTDGGIFHRQPGTDEVGTNVLTGSGDNAMTADLTYQRFTDTTTPREVWLTSAAGPEVGIRTFTDGSTVYNFEIAATPNYVAANDWEAQPNISNGRYETDGTGSFVVLENAAFNFWLSITDTHIHAVFNLAPGIYTKFELQFIDRYATSSEHAYPMLVGGCSSRHDFNQSTNASGWAGTPQCIVESASDEGPVQVYDPGGFWRSVSNGRRSINDVVGDTDSMRMLPCGWFDPQDTDIAEEDRIVHDTSGQKSDWETFASVATTTGGTFGPASDILRPTPTTGDPQTPLTACVIGGVAPSNQILGQMDGVAWVEQNQRTGTLTAEDEIVDENDDLWVVFNNCRLTGRTHYWAMRVN